SAPPGGRGSEFSPIAAASPLSLVNSSVLSRAVDLECNQGDVILGTPFACPGLDGPQHPPDSVTQRFGGAGLKLHEQSLRSELLARRIHRFRQSVRVQPEPVSRAKSQFGVCVLSLLHDPDRKTG